MRTSRYHAADLAAASRELKGQSLRVVVDLLHFGKCQLFGEQHAARERQRLGRGILGGIKKERWS